MFPRLVASFHSSVNISILNFLHARGCEFGEKDQMSHII